MDENITGGVSVAGLATAGAASGAVDDLTKCDHRRRYAPSYIALPLASSFIILPLLETSLSSFVGMHFL